MAIFKDKNNKCWMRKQELLVKNYRKQCGDSLETKNRPTMQSSDITPRHIPEGI
jgi:hypothetical protein